MAVRGAQPDSRQLVREADWHAGRRSSRRSADDAGWEPAGADWQKGNWTERLRRLRNRRWRDFSWLTARTLLDSANDQIAKLIHDLVNDRRQQWVAWQRAAGVEGRCPDFTIQYPVAARVLLVGDPGEADASQYAVVDPLLSVDASLQSDFMVILSDVVYPAGDVNDYVNAFYEAYGEYGKPILAIPGNHDWYDGLDGFMFHFCGVEALPPTSFRSSSYGTPERVARRLWRSSARPERARLLSRRFARNPDWMPPQPGPYWALDMDGVRLVAIDTGIKGTLDREQGEWLLRVSRGDTPKVLLTGKPLWVDGEPRKTPIEWGEDSEPPVTGLEDVDAVVRRAEHRYVAAIGGDVHNYQRLAVGLEDGRRMEYVVAGGSGAYMSATHRIGRVGEAKAGVPEDVTPPRDEDFRCYPTRGDSLAYYAGWFGLRMVKGFVIALLVLVLALAGAVGWALAGDEPAHGLLRVMIAAVAGIVVIGAVAVVPGYLTHKAMPVGYRTLGVLLVVPAALALAAVGLERVLGDTWDWAWKAALLGSAVLLVPIAGVLIGYYAFSPGRERKMRLDLTLCALAVGTVALYAGDLTTLRGAALTVGLGLLALAVLLRILTWLRPLLRRRAAERGSRLGTAARSPWFYVPVTAALWGAVPALVAVRFWDADAIRIAVAACLAFVTVGSALFVIVVALGGRRALWDVARGHPLEADTALSYLHHRLGIAETFPDEHDPSRLARVGNFDDRSARICELLLPGPRGPRAWINRLVTEVGNADEPPMFKSFVTLAVDDGELVIAARGVTGWMEHEQDVPYEDEVRIPLG